MGKIPYFRVSLFFMVCFVMAFFLMLFFCMVCYVWLFLRTSLRSHSFRATPSLHYLYFRPSCSILLRVFFCFLFSVLLFLVRSLCLLSFVSLFFSFLSTLPRASPPQRQPGHVQCGGPIVGL